MKMRVYHILTASVTAGLMAFSATQAAALLVTRSQNLAQPHGWSAVAGMDTHQVMQIARHTEIGEVSSSEHPYCDLDQTVQETLAHDFGEKLISQGSQDTQLWGSSAMGTWTVVLARQDATSCVIASGIGYSEDANPGLYFTKAGLNG